MHALLRHSLHPERFPVLEGAFAKDTADDPSDEVFITVGSW